MLNPVWIGVIGTILALAIIANAIRILRRTEDGRGLGMLHIIMTLLFVGVIWFIILNLIPAQSGGAA